MNRKKTLIIMFGWLLFLITDQIHAQVCQQIEIATDSVKKEILRQFIDDAWKNRYFINDKGIVKLKVYKDEQGRERWYLYPLIDDSYKASPPTKYAIFGEINSTVILVYEADSRGIESKPQQNMAAINQCLDQVVEDRVYIRPPYSKRLRERIMPDGRKLMIEDRVHKLGNNGDLIIIFHKNGTIEKVYPS